jgi:Helicase conserved C-terminal domain
MAASTGAPASVSDDNTSPVPIKLWSSQKGHFQRVSEILKTSHAYLDTSPMGAGKTVVTLAIAAIHGLDLFVVCPKSTASMWQKEANKYGVRVRSIMTYQMLTGTTSGGCNHAFLRRHDDVFIPTGNLQQIIGERTLFVFDEMHAVKNPGTGVIKASHSIVKEVVRLNCGSRVALLSATPCDKEIHAQNVLKMLGIIIDDDLYHYDRYVKNYEPLGITELISRCDSLDRVTSESIHSGVMINNKTSNKLCYDLFVHVVKNFCSSSMELPSIESEKDAMNGYYWMPNDDVIELQRGVDLLSSSTQFDESTGSINIGKGSFGMITTALIMIEKAKLNTMIRLARETLEADPNCKVILYVWYIDSIKTLDAQLKEYAPMYMYGDTKAEERDSIVSKFQEENTNHRLLISNAKVGGIGISLDDRCGKHKRHLFMIPSYNFIDLHQATGRIHRGTTKSTAHIRFVYSKDFTQENSILNAIAKKSQVTKSMLFKEDGIKFPGDYPSFVEDRDS